MRGYLPFTTNDLFLIRVASIFCSPLAWIVVAGALTLGYPLGRAPNPFTGIVAVLVFLLLGLFVSVAITDVLQSGVARKLGLIVVLVASVVGGLLWIEKRVELVASVKSLLPQRLAALAAVSTRPLNSVAALVVITVVFALLARWTFTLTLQPRTNRRSQTFSFFGVPQLPGKFGGLINKDLRYASRLLDLYLALPLIVSRHARTRN